MTILKLNCRTKPRRYRIHNSKLPIHPHKLMWFSLMVNKGLLRFTPVLRYVGSELLVVIVLEEDWSVYLGLHQCVQEAFRTQVGGCVGEKPRLDIVPIDINIGTVSEIARQTGEILVFHNPEQVSIPNMLKCISPCKICPKERS